MRFFVALFSSFCSIASVKTIAYSEVAILQLRKLPANLRKRMIDKLELYARTGSGDVTALKGRDGTRLRVGDYRIIFTETRDAIEVHAAGHRRAVYD